MIHSGPESRLSRVSLTDILGMLQEQIILLSPLGGKLLFVTFLIILEILLTTSADWTEIRFYTCIITIVLSGPHNDQSDLTQLCIEHGCEPHSNSSNLVLRESGFVKPGLKL